jgi:hypothetical protein
MSPSRVGRACFGGLPHAGCICGLRNRRRLGNRVSTWKKGREGSWGRTDSVGGGDSDPEAECLVIFRLGDVVLLNPMGSEVLIRHSHGACVWSCVGSARGREGGERCGTYDMRFIVCSCVRNLRNDACVGLLMLERVVRIVAASRGNRRIETSNSGSSFRF